VEKRRKVSAPGRICLTLPAWNFPLKSGGAVGGVDMMADHSHSRDGRPLSKPEGGRADDGRKAEKPTEEEKAPLEFASLRLRQKLMVRRAIRDTPVRQGTASRGRRRS